MISIHAPVRGATDEFATSRMVLTISIHAPVRGATTANCTCVSPNLWHFNPRSREGSDGLLIKKLNIYGISIHAPVRGATDVQGRERAYAAISIHAPVRGATFVAVQDSTLAQISIHAPVRGATSDRSLKSFTISHFNPRSREGSDSRLPINAYNLI